MAEQTAATFREEDLIPRLIEEFGYSPAGARSVAPKLVASAPAIREAFWRWWVTGESPTAPEVEGFTLEQLVGEKNLKVPAAYAALDWLLREPRVARDALSRRFDHGAPVRPRPSE